MAYFLYILYTSQYICICHMHCVHPTEPGPSQVELEGGRGVEAQEGGKESYSDDEDERCMVEEDRSHSNGREEAREFSHLSSKLI